MSINKLYRKYVDSRARRQGSVSVSATSCRRIYHCVCGATDTESAKYRPTKHARIFSEKHKNCMENIVFQTIAEKYNITDPEVAEMTIALLAMDL